MRLILSLSPQLPPRRGAAQKKLRERQPEMFEQLSQEETAAMKSLQDNLISQPVLTLQSHNGIYTLDIDSFNAEVDCLLLQEQDNGINRRIVHFIALLMTYSVPVI